MRSCHADLDPHNDSNSSRINSASAAEVCGNLSGTGPRRRCRPYLLRRAGSCAGVTAGHSGAPASDVSNIPKPLTDTFERVQMRNAPYDAQAGQKTAEKENTCLLPPLTLVRSPIVAATALQVPPKARKEYQEACSALNKKKTADAEKHVRKAVHEYPKYSVAWVTMGQVLAAQHRIDDARSACSQGSTANPMYVPAQLCLADIAAQAHDWSEVLKLSSHALELDPSNNAVAYEYHAAANLNLHKLREAEKSGLRAVEIDK